MVGVLLSKPKGMEMCGGSARLKSKISGLCSQISWTAHNPKLMEVVDELGSNEFEVFEREEQSDLHSRMPFISVRQKKK